MPILIMGLIALGCFGFIGVLLATASHGERKQHQPPKH
jgi:hypothetical protein